MKVVMDSAGNGSVPKEFSFVVFFFLFLSSKNFLKKRYRCDTFYS